MINNISQSCELLKLNGILQSYQAIAEESSKIGCVLLSKFATHYDLTSPPNII